MDLYVGYRFTHQCPSPGRDRPLVVTRIDTGWKWYCHRCGEKGIKWAKGLSPKEWLKFNEAPAVQPNTAVSKVTLPHGMTDDIPAVGLAWLYKYHLTDTDIKRFNIGYSTTLNRVVLPVYDQHGKLVYYQARNLGEITDKSPKYMNVKTRGRRGVYFLADQEPADSIVLVEDILSAIRVSSFLPTIGLLYAYIPDELVVNLNQVYDQIIFWLDPDKHDRMIGRVKRYRTLGINAVMIRADKDPKFYMDDEIDSYLQEV